MAPDVHHHDLRRVLLDTDAVLLGVGTKAEHELFGALTCLADRDAAYAANAISTFSAITPFPLSADSPVSLCYPPAKGRKLAEIGTPARIGCLTQARPQI